MRAGGALQVLCVVAALAGGIGYSPAQDADDVDADDEEVEIAGSRPSPWRLLLDPLTASSRSFALFTRVMPDRQLYFTGFDVWRSGFGMHAGMQWAPKGLNNDGFFLRFYGSEALERFTTPQRRYENQIFRGAIGPGYRIRRGQVEVQLSTGLDIGADYLLLNKRFIATRRMVGARFTADLWWEPTRSLMLQYWLSGSTIDDGFNTRLAGGWRLLDRFWVGPEIALAQDSLSRQFRIGVHMTGFRTGDYEWTMAVGHSNDSFHREGIYGRLGIVVRPPRDPFFEN